MTFMACGRFIAFFFPGVYVGGWGLWYIIVTINNLVSWTQNLRIY